jgi:hypothetical protein
MNSEKLKNIHQKYILTIEKEVSAKLLLNNLLEFQKEISDEIIDTGRNNFKFLENINLKNTAEKSSVIPYIKFSYYIINDVISYLLLLRDYYFQLKKTELLNNYNEIQDEKLTEYTQTVITEISTAFSELLINDFENNKNSDLNKKQQQKVIKKLRYKNPWHINEKKIENINQQFNYLKIKFENLVITGNTFNNIQKKLLNSGNSGKIELDEIKKKVSDVENLLSIKKQNVNKDNIEELIKQLDKIESEVKYKYHIEEFNVLLLDDIEKLTDETQFPIDIQSNNIIYTDVNFKLRLKYWLDKNIFPPLSEIWEIVEVNSNGLKMAIRNMINILRNAIDTGELKNFDVTISELSEYIKPFSKNIHSGEIFINNLSTRTLISINTDMKLSVIFNQKKYFLTSGAEINNYKPEFIIFKPLNKLIKLFSTKSNQISLYFQNLKYEQKTGNKEKIVRYIKEREVKESNSHYDNFFITKGYYGDTFLVERKNEKKQIKEVYLNWLDNFRASVLVYGEHTSGKTVFCESFASEFFPLHTIRLVPGTKIQNAKTKIELTYNLEKTLKTIQKEYKEERNLILIDNLELWWDNEYTLSFNIKSLCTFIDKYSERFFVLASVNSATKNYISELMPFDKTFQAIIDIGPLSFEQTIKAIQNRHIAAQKTLINKRNKQPVGKSEFKKYVKQIYKHSNGLTGQSLFLWTLFTTIETENSVIFNSLKLNKLPDFINNENGLILSYIYLQKKTTEIRLRKMFGPDYKDNYENIVKRLSGLGVLKRNVAGWIEINELIIDDLADLLKQKKLIEF